MQNIGYHYLLVLWCRNVCSFARSSCYTGQLYVSKYTLSTNMKRRCN